MNGLKLKIGYVRGEGGGGGGEIQNARHHPPTLKSSLRASQICYYFCRGVWGKKSYEVSKLGGGGGGSLP